jgi:hypothetical protein
MKRLKPMIVYKYPPIASGGLTLGALVAHPMIKDQLVDK